MKKSYSFPLVLLLGLSPTLPGMAQSLQTTQTNTAPSESSQPAFPDNLFSAGKWDFSLFSGPMFSPIGHPDSRPTVDYELTAVELGYMLSDVNHAPGPLRGNWELVPSAIGAAIFRGKGNYIAGGTLWLRYNFVQPNWRVVPYLQGGAGITFTDTDNYLLGERFNFNLNAALGMRWLVASHCAINLEYLYQHISNADLSSHNIGINAQGPLLGVSYFF